MKTSNILNGAVLLAAVGCASGGGPPVSGPEADELFAAYSGNWTLDETDSSPQIPNELEGVPENPPDDLGSVRNPGNRDYYRRRRPSAGPGAVSVAAMRETVEFLRQRPEKLFLRVTASDLSLTPGSGETMTLAVDGSEWEHEVKGQKVNTKVVWQGPLLTIEHHVIRGGRVIEQYEVVGDRMIVSRWFQGGDRARAQVLAYDRG